VEGAFLTREVPTLMAMLRQAGRGNSIPAGKQVVIAINGRQIANWDMFQFGFRAL
jgi:hypothetical protein